MTMFEALKISILKKSQHAFQLLQLTMHQMEMLVVSDVLSMSISDILIADQLENAVDIAEILLDKRAIATTNCWQVFSQTILKLLKKFTKKK